MIMQIDRYTRHAVNAHPMTETTDREGPEPMLTVAPIPGPILPDTELTPGPFPEDAEATVLS